MKILLYTNLSKDPGFEKTKEIDYTISKFLKLNNKGSNGKVD